MDTSRDEGTKPSRSAFNLPQVTTMLVWLIGTALLNALTYYWQTDRTTQVGMAELRKEVQSIGRSIDRMERRLDLLENKVDASYTRQAADAEFNEMFSLFEDLTGRVTRIEANGS